MLNDFHPMRLNMVLTGFPTLLSPNGAQNPIFSRVDGISANRLTTITLREKPIMGGDFAQYITST